MTDVVTVEPDPTLAVHDRVVEIRYGGHGKIYGFYKAEDLVCVVFDQEYTSEWSKTNLAWIPRNQLIRESEWEKMKGEKHGD